MPKQKTTKIKKKRKISGKCFFCAQKINPDYKDTDTLKKFISERGKIIAKSYTGVCHKHQKILGKEIKKARFLALLPFIVRPG